MKRTERIIWVSIVSLLIFLALFAFFIKEARAKNLDLKNIYINKFLQVLEVVEKDYVDEDIDHKKLMNGAIKGMLEAIGDPHTVYLSEKEMKDMLETSKGRYGGVGMLISEQEKKIVVISPFEDSPAYKKGIKAGDFILTVDDVSLEGKTSEEAANLLRGEPGTTVKVEILSRDVTYTVEIKRALIDLPSVKHAIINDNYGYLRIIQFAGTTDKHVKDALIEFKQKNVKGIIVDLRHNPGGLLGQVIKIIDFFQNEGVIVSTIGRDASQTDVSNASKLTTIVNEDIPVVVIVDKGSASASEIFAGALKDTKRGILIGEKTYGKGSVQTFYSLGKDGFKMTIAKYYTPSNKVIDGVGIEPDIEVKEPELTEVEKTALKKIYEDKVIDDFAKKNTNPTEKEIDDFINVLYKKGYNLSERYLKKLIRNAVEFDNDKRPIYDLEFDVQLQKALELFDNNIIKKNKEVFYLDKKKIKNIKSDITKINNKKEDIKKDNNENVFILSFKPNSFVLLNNEKKYLDNIVKILLKIPNKNILVVGHSAESGTAIEQMRLSLQRAQYIADYLKKNGIPSERITHMGKGATEPITSNNTEKNRQKNRRVEINIKNNK